MEVGIVGLATSGKSTLFSLLTGHTLSTAPARHGALQMGVARVPDQRLQALSEMYRPKKQTPATITYVDAPGIPQEHGREASFNLPELRNSDVLMVALRAFPDDAVHHPMGSVDPLRDLRHIEDELILQDQLVVERRLDRIRRDLAKRRTPELASEGELLEHCLEVLECERPLRSEDFTEEENKRLRGFTFLSIKPTLVVLNVGETAIAEDPFDSEAWSAWRAQEKMAFTRVCATLERELAELDAADAQVFMEDLGITESALDRVSNESYRLLGLVSFFTVGEDECRAWSVRAGTPAVEAGGVIHSDIQRGFIRAEVVPNHELRNAGSLTVCRQRGSLRLEGKSYPVQDGEVVHFRFNV
jgi:GTP-binding protein YchF